MSDVAGYSGTPLAKKLGIASGHTVVVLDGPPGFQEWLDPLPDQVRFRASIGTSPHIVIVFATDRAKLDRRIATAARAIFPDGAIWAAWPKRSSKVATDITEDSVRDIALPLGLVDNKVCAINEVWSGLRVVWRRENRTRDR